MLRQTTAVIPMYDNRSKIISRLLPFNDIYIISEDTSIFAPQRISLYKALGVAACTVGKVRSSTVFMCVCSTF